MNLGKERCGDRALPEGKVSREHLVEHDAERVEVRRGRDGCGAARLFRAHVGGGADEAGLVGSFVGQGVVAEVCDAEVHQLDARQLTVGAEDHDVLGLEIAVNDAAGVSVGEGVEDLEADGEEMLSCRRALAPGRELLPGYQFHDEEVEPIGPPEVPELRDVGVVEAGGRAGLAEEAPLRLLLAGHRLSDHLDCNLGASGRAAAIDDAHAARTEALGEFVCAELGRQREVGGGVGAAQVGLTRHADEAR